MSGTDIPVLFGTSEAEQAAFRQRIAEGIARRRQQAVERHLDFQRLALGEHTPQAGASPLADLRLYQDKIYLHPTPAVRFATGIKPLDSLLAKIRGELHNLAVFYCNRLGERQMLFNQRLVQLVATLADADQTAVLDDRVSALEKRLAELERRSMEGTGDH
jgi:hypothetical protein